jgi:hypothetical protein
MKPILQAYIGQCAKQAILSLWRQVWKIVANHCVAMFCGELAGVEPKFPNRFWR